MAHLSPVRLADLAADPSGPPGRDELEHLRGCPTCRAQAAELNDLVRDLRLARPTDLRPPGPAVWGRVQRELRSGTTAAGDDRPRRARVRTAVAALAGLVVGIGGTVTVASARSADATDVVASTSLAPLPGEAGRGTAELVRDRDSLQLRVHVTLGAEPPDDYHEVWLINSDGHRMVSLGVLPASGDARYWLPAPLTDRLDGYQTVDISLEPGDGVVTHSQHSLVRGELPG